ncbi:hypothetical protein X275_05800 [Marinitoga sp. 1197]|uniref:nucleotidyltransferase family protein n=1 Tax=Marinitoga sp. 1197 TaxID=1428449 RepID=UPI000641666B|nr:nucleotidyltransferase domain-containing protein [Marinitoga sp. 1197]KLO22566.1 hypothetical protein X275_05800 [Marinitoga sp. 1197]
MTFDIKEEYFNLIIKILKKHIQSCTIIIFGSRITGKSNEASDLDIAIDCGKKLDLITLFEIEEDFQDSNLPFRVDLIDWQRTSESFKNIILNNCMKIKI